MRGVYLRGTREGWRGCLALSAPVSEGGVGVGGLREREGGELVFPKSALFIRPDMVLFIIMRGGI